MRRLGSLLLLAGLLLRPPGACAGDDPPDWLKMAAATATPTYPPRVAAVVLLQEETVRIDGNGRASRLERHAVRVLRREGAAHAVASVLYNTDGGHVRSLRAWMIPPAGSPHRYRDRDVVDLAAIGGDMYNEDRVRVLHAEGDATDGSVFGYEAEYESREIFTQYEFSFQDDLPTLRSRFAVIPPKGWHVEGTLINHETLAPSATGREYAWELRDLPPIPDEPYRPPRTELAPRLAVSVLPPEGTEESKAVAFRSWAEVSAWMSRHADPMAGAEEPIVERARSVAAGAATEWDRVRAVGKFVQGLTYASIQLGTRRGGGFIPRPAARVLELGYGDCKDKANLMKALLGALDVPAYLVLIRSDDRDYVRESWPSLQQFDHCIVAVHLADRRGGAVYNDPRLGPLLFFDPTDPDVPAGDLPSDEQSGPALLVAGDAGHLIRAPALPDSGDLKRRRIETRLAADGSISGTMTERTTGRFAVEERALFRHTPTTEYRKLVERWVSRGVGGTEVDRLGTDEEDGGRAFVLHFDFGAARYAQTIGPRMLAVRPLLIERGEAPMFPESRRTLPVVLGSVALEETTRMQLPAGFAVEELPEPATLAGPFGTYHLEFSSEGDTLIASRSLRIRSGRVPPGDYASLRDFFARLHAAEQTPVVISRP
jgi:transglutaminase-like putative cysteine protease